MTDIRDKLSKFEPLRRFHFGHTPFQIEHFKTTSQKGDRRFEYWQHVLQLKSLDRGIKELLLDIADIEDQIADAKAWMPFWNRSRRKRQIPRLTHRLSTLTEGLEERKLEAVRTFEVLQRSFSDLFALTEEELFAGEGAYWVTRLTKQIQANALAMRYGITAGDVSAVMSLPEEEQAKVLASMLKRQELGARDGG